MKIIDLLNKIANGEDVPKRIKYISHYFDYSETEKDYYEGMGYEYEYLLKNCSTVDLNDEVEIIEEDKKIEKLKIVENGSINSYALLDKNGTKCALTKHSKVMCDKINEMIDKINKGDE